MQDDSASKAQWKGEFFFCWFRLLTPEGLWLILCLVIYSFNKHAPSMCYVTGCPSHWAYGDEPTVTFLCPGRGDHEGQEQGGMWQIGTCCKWRSHGCLFEEVIGAEIQGYRAVLSLAAWSRLRKAEEVAWLKAGRFQDRRLVLVLLIFHLIQEIGPATLGDVKKGFKILVLKACYYNEVCFYA